MMENQENEYLEKARKKQWYLCCAAAILCFLPWFGLLTDYSWNSLILNIVFPPVMGIIGIALYKNEFTPGVSKLIARIVGFFLAFGGFPNLVIIVLAVFPPFLLATMFYVGEQCDAVLVQRQESPSGLSIAEVYHYPVGAYSGGNGRVEIHLRYKYLPFVKRDLYYLRASRSSEETQNYIFWLDENTIYVTETKEKIEFGIVERRIPPFISLPIGFIKLLLRGSEMNHLKDGFLSTPILFS